MTPGSYERDLREMDAEEIKRLREENAELKAIGREVADAYDCTGPDDEIVIRFTSAIAKLKEVL